MIKLFASACIEAPAELVWAQLAQLQDIQLWSEAVVHARCDGPIGAILMTMWKGAGRCAMINSD
jgi:hypothetical protein